MPQPYGKAVHVTKLLVHSMLCVPGGAMLSHHAVIGCSKQCIPHECILISSPSFVVSYASPPTSSFKMFSHLTQTCEALAVSHALCWPRYMCPQRQQPTRRLNSCNIYKARLRGFWRGGGLHPVQADNQQHLQALSLTAHCNLETSTSIHLLLVQFHQFHVYSLADYRCKP